MNQEREVMVILVLEIRKLKNCHILNILEEKKRARITKNTKQFLYDLL